MSVSSSAGEKIRAPGDLRDIEVDAARQAVT